MQFKDCVFIYNAGKSDGFILSLLEKMGEIKSGQKYKLVSGKKPHLKNKIIVYVDDILASGETTERRFAYFPDNIKYCLHVVSNEIGRVEIDKDINQIYIQNSFNSKNSKFPFVKKQAVLGLEGIQECNSSEIFFFSFSDTSHILYRQFAREVLNLKDR